MNPRELCLESKFPESIPIFANDHPRSGPKPSRMRASIEREYRSSGVVHPSAVLASRFEIFSYEKNSIPGASISIGIAFYPGLASLAAFAVWKSSLTKIGRLM